jgi:hypothetical protein
VNFFTVSKLAVEGFRKLSSGPKVVIATGNVGPWLPPSGNFFAVQFQKKIIAALVETFVSQYQKEGIRYVSMMCPGETRCDWWFIRFYFASQVEHTPVSNISGNAHAIAYLRLVNTLEQMQWEQRYSNHFTPESTRLKQPYRQIHRRWYVAQCEALIL